MPTSRAASGILRGRAHLASGRRPRAGTAAGRRARRSRRARISTPSALIDELVRESPAAVVTDARGAAERAHVGRELLQEQFWITIASPNVVRSGTSTPDRRLRSSSAAAARSRATQHHRQREHECRRTARRSLWSTTTQTQVRAEHGDVAVREVDDAHDAEDQRQPAGEQRVEPAEQDPLHDRVDPGHAAPPPRPRCSPKYALGDLLPVELAGRALEHDAPLEHAHHAVGHAQRAARGPARRARPSCPRRSASRSDGRRSSTAIGASPSETSSSSSRRGFVISARADRRRLLLAAGERGGRACGAAARAAGTPRAPRSTFHGPAGAAAVARRAGSPRPSAAGSSRRPSGTSAMPEPTRL